MIVQKIMKVHHLGGNDLETSTDEGFVEHAVPIARRAEALSNIDDAAKVADEMAVKSAVLVEMMEDLEEWLRRRMAHLNDPAPVYSRKVRRMQAREQHQGEPIPTAPQYLDERQQDIASI